MRLGASSRSPLRFLWPLLAFLLVAALAFLLLRPARQPAGVGALEGQAAPLFTLKALDGSTVDLASFRGRPLVLNFWASWCGPCKEEAPLFRQLDQRRAVQDFQLLGVLFQETSEADARAFVKKYGLTYPNALDPRLTAGSAYLVSGIPQTVFIDAKGTIRHIDRGGLDKARLNEGLRKIGVKPL